MRKVSARLTTTKLRPNAGWKDFRSQCGRLYLARITSSILFQVKLPVRPILRLMFVGRCIKSVTKKVRSEVGAM
jgi:hypothetical protein